nr:MAG TPA: hypothetical protein [Caudoviricetes sp.]
MFRIATINKATPNIISNSSYVLISNHPSCQDSERMARTPSRLPR